MLFIDLARQRYSSRKYKPIHVEEEKLIKVLEAARIAPSAANRQPWIFYIVRDEENRKQLHSIYNRDWFKEPPVIIVACADHSKSWIRLDGKDHADIDLAIAIDHITLQATELGLATCWVCNFDVKGCKSILKLEENIEPIAMITMGYPDDSPIPDRHLTVRKPLSDIIKWEI